MQHTTTQPKIAAITTPQFVVKKSAFMIALAALGGMSILAGVISSVSAIVLLSEASMPGIVNSVLADVTCNFILGILIMTSWRALAQGKMLAVWFFGSSLLVDSFYSLVMGYQLNYIFMGFGLLLIWHMVKYKAELELS
ncbi:MAG TPA: hypothetical protein VJM08_06910 [Anaerolineales bacterium]|nr:hypothetical protein [Anaerolineales bacterium]